ncbi:DUF6146 family protein [Pseudotenacibaculum sp. MALMAid0570]|uniref:DUF6146 family protein n=1 Tax=Pseudotenacibaculum sp. MALMAid0570 TaxID=3143938 RepID=UPI0032DEFEC5
MRHLHKILGVFILGILVYACSSTSSKNLKIDKNKEEPVVIANDSLEYEVIIFDTGFQAYLSSTAKPMGFYSQTFLENWNRIYVLNWNMRARDPIRFDPNIYGNVIDYDHKINYGMEVNYKLFNYFQFAQRKYRMRLDGGSGAPRIR